MHGVHPCLPAAGRSCLEQLEVWTLLLHSRCEFLRSSCLKTDPVVCQFLKEEDEEVWKAAKVIHC